MRLIQEIQHLRDCEVDFYSKIATIEKKLNASERGSEDAQAKVHCNSARTGGAVKHVTGPSPVD